MAFSAHQQHIITHLRNICSTVLDDASLTLIHDWRGRYVGQALAVVFPANSAEIQAIVQFAHTADFVIIPQGGNTSSCGGAVPVAKYHKPQIVLNLAYMTKIIDIDSQNKSIQVEAGCTLEAIQQAALRHQLYFPLELACAKQCQIGGNVATNAGGMNVLKYGNVRQLTLGLEAVLADGTVLDVNQALYKNNTYLDTKQLLIGSEGTLGIITQANLTLADIPKYCISVCVGVVSIPQSLELLAILQDTFQHRVSSFEIISADSQNIYNAIFTQQPFPLTAPWVIILKIEYCRCSNLALRQLFRKAGIDDTLIIARSPQEAQQLWHIRSNIPIAERAFSYAVKHDIAVPLSCLEQFISTNKLTLLSRYPTGFFSIFGHLGDGNLHYNFGIKGTAAANMPDFELQVNDLVYADVQHYAGSIAAEHGIGQLKIHQLAHYSNSTEYALMYAVKCLLDPQCLFNPDKVFLSPLR